MTTTKVKSENAAIEVMAFREGRARYHIVGKTPLIFNRMTEKAKRHLLLPSGRKTAAEKNSAPKHDVYAEFRESPYAHRERADTETLLYMPPVALKKAIAAAAIDMPGTAKRAVIQRMIRIADQHVSVFGVPEILISVVRTADMAKTPDIRSRAILREWTASFTIDFPEPQLTASTIAQLVIGAGRYYGIGDWRQEKGSGDFGLFDLVDEDDATMARIRAEGGRAAQVAAMANPALFDDDTAEILSWYESEAAKRFPQLIEPRAIAAE